LSLHDALPISGIWAALAMFAAWLFYQRNSRRLGLGMLAVFLAMSALTWWLHGQLGTRGLLWLAVGVFVVAWIAQFIGHRIEGRKPSFLTDLVYLLIGPAWVLSKLYRRLGWRWWAAPGASRNAACRGRRGRPAAPAGDNGACPPATSS